MSKFVIECPECGRYVEASNSFFARKKIDCTCGYTINVRTDKMASKICPHCGNQVIYDQSKGSKALCPVCKEPVNTTESLINVVEFTCPSCSCKLTADKSASQYTCPLCDTVIDVARQVAKQKEKNKGLASVIKYEGDNQTLVWKHPIEDFNLGSQLIVHESQEAVFFRDGRGSVSRRPIYTGHTESSSAGGTIQAARQCRYSLPLRGIFRQSDGPDGD